MLDRLIKFIISTIYFVLSTIINLIQFPFIEKSSDKLVVLTYHSVKPWQRDKFANQMDQVIKVGKPVFADMGNGSNKDGHHIAITFDDGFRNFIENALPEMLVRKIPATLFIPTGYLGEFPGWIKNPAHENAQEILMSADQLRGLPGEQVKIGSHGITHPRLTSLTKEQIIRELSESKRQLESILERDITLLSFPYDDYNEEILELARETGYSHLFKDIPTYPISKTDSFLLGRISVSPEDWNIEYWLKLKGSYQWLPFAVRMKQLISKILSKGGG